MNFFLKIIIFAMVSLGMQAKYHTVKSDKDLETLTQKYQYCVVCFAPSGSADFKNVQNRLQAAAKRDSYQRLLSKDVGFLLVDTDAKKADGLAYDYKLSNLPSCLIFDSQLGLQNTVQASPKSATEIIKMLEKQFGKEIVTLKKDREEDLRARRDEQIASYYNYSGMSNWWYPYTYWPYSRWGSGPYFVSYALDTSYC